jgi:hypothetical protein
MICDLYPLCKRPNNVKEQERFRSKDLGLRCECHFMIVEHEPLIPLLALLQDGSEYTIHLVSNPRV